MKTLSVILWLLFWLVFLIATPSLGAGDKFDDLSLDQLLDIEFIELITRKEEPLLQSSLDVSVVHGDDIIRSGATSIPEALRLIPGVVVREQTPGNFDVHIRGLAEISNNVLAPFPASTTMLVMIDYRVVYNYFSGGTFWETLPIDVHDLERIEVIRGPATALYGANAATGVINFITKTPGAGNARHRLTSNFRSADDFTVGAAETFQLTRRLAGVVSLNASRRKRFASSYYDWSRRSYQDLDELNSTLTLPNFDDPSSSAGHIDKPGDRYPQVDRAQERMGLNLFTHYTISHQAKISVSSGVQRSQAQKILLNNFATPLTTNDSNTHYVDVNGTFGNWSTHFSRLRGVQETLGMPEWRYNLDVIDGVVDYSFGAKYWKLRPALSFRQATYAGNFIGESHAIAGGAMSLLGDLSLVQETLRLLGAVRVDSYNHPKDPYLSFQFSSRYSLSAQQAVHASFGRAHRAPFILDNYAFYYLTTEHSVVHYLGNTDLKLLTIDTADVGWRGKVSQFLTLKGSIFNSSVYNISDMVYLGMNTAAAKTEVQFKYQNIDLSTTQTGVTGESVLAISPGSECSIFATWQHTNYWKKGQRVSGTRQSVPQIYGGLRANYRYRSWLNVAFSGYFLGPQTFYDFRGSERDQLAGLPIVSVRVSYALPFGELFINGRNLLSKGKGRREFGYSDPIGTTIFVGINSPTPES